MSRAIKFTVAFVITILWGCGETQKPDYLEFKTSKTLIFKEVGIPNLFRSPADLVLNQDLILVYDFQLEWFFHAFTAKDYSHIGSLIRRGRGPEEEVFIAPYFKLIGKDTLLYQNHNSVKLGRIEMEAEGVDLSVLNEFNLPTEIQGNLDFFKLDTLLLSSVSEMPVTKDFQVFCTKTGELFEEGATSPGSKSRANDEWGSSLSGKLTSLRPDKKKFASVFYSFPIVRIYDATNMDLLRELHISSGSSNDKGDVSDGQQPNPESGSLSYYWRIRTTDEFIFALFSGATPSEVEIEGFTPSHSDVASKIHVWDWDGNPVMKLELERPVFSFDVTPDNEQIIALSIVDVETLLVADIPWD